MKTHTGFTKEGEKFKTCLEQLQAGLPYQKELVEYHIKALRHHLPIFPKTFKGGFRHIYDPIQNRNVDMEDDGVFFFTGNIVNDSEQAHVSEYLRFLLGHQFLNRFLDGKNIDFTLRTLTFSAFETPSPYAMRVFNPTERRRNRCAVNVYNEYPVIDIHLPTPNRRCYSNLQDVIDTFIKSITDTFQEDNTNDYLDKRGQLKNKLGESDTEDLYCALCDEINKLDEDAFSTILKNNLQHLININKTNETEPVFWSKLAQYFFSMYLATWRWKMYAMIPCMILENNCGHSLWFDSVVQVGVILRMRKEFDLEFASISNLFSKMQLKHYARNSAVAAIMSRNMSHNMGSHVSPRATVEAIEHRLDDLF